MSIECPICSELLLKAGIKVSSTPVCGHVYHADCLKSWVEKNNNKGICPVCRAHFDPAKVVALHSLDDNQTKAIDGIYDFVKNFEKTNVEQKSFMEFMVDAMNNVTAALTDIKMENNDLRLKMQHLEKGGYLGASPAAEHLKAKDLEISHLKKEVQELRKDKADITKKFQEIQEQLNYLNKKDKETRNPLKDTTNENEEPKPNTLTIKFDDISDRMILGEF